MYLQEAELDKLSFHSLYMVMCDVQSERHNIFHRALHEKKKNRTDCCHHMNTQTTHTHTSPLFIYSSAVTLYVCALLLWFWIMLTHGSVQDSASSYYILFSVLFSLCH